MGFVRSGFQCRRNLAAHLGGVRSSDRMSRRGSLAHYPHGMSIVTAESEALRAMVAAHRPAVNDVLRQYQAANPRLFGSVARGDATPNSDIDLLVDLLPNGGNGLLRVAGIAEELTELLGTRVDVVAVSLLRGEVSASALADAVAV
jgi:predicted nucleotidyltransferase